MRAKLYMTIFDIHDVHPNKKSLKNKVYHPVVKCFLDVAKAYKPDGILLGGDISDIESLSYFDRDKRKRMEGRRYRKDIDSVNHLLCEIDEATKHTKEKIYLLGNHEERVATYCDYHPEADGTYDYVEDTGLVARGYEVIPYNKIYKIGHALFMHGHDATKYHAHKMAHIYYKSIFYGHTHDHQVYSFVSPIDYQEVRVATSMGCACNENPEWLKGRPNRWVHMFGMLWVLDSGEFFMDLKHVIRGKTVINGKVFGG